jgi:hypothetical protein
LTSINTFYLKVELEVSEACDLKVPGQIVPTIQKRMISQLHDVGWEITKTEAAMSPTAFLNAPVGRLSGNDAYRAGKLDGQLQIEEALILFLQEHGSGEHWVVTQNQIGELRAAVDNAQEELTDTVNLLSDLVSSIESLR